MVILQYFFVDYIQNNRLIQSFVRHMWCSSAITHTQFFPETSGSLNAGGFQSFTWPQNINTIKIYSPFMVKKVLMYNTSNIICKIFRFVLNMWHYYVSPLTLNTVILLKLFFIYFNQSYFHLFFHFFSELFHGEAIEHSSNTENRGW